MFFLWSSNVFAFDWDDTNEYSTLSDLIDGCGKFNSCVPVCVYRDGDKIEKQFGIFYHYDSKDWEMVFYGNNGFKHNSVKKLQSEDIYWEDRAGSWKDSAPEAYNNLNDDFKCPSYVTVYGYKEVCFSNQSQDQCDKNDKFDNFLTRHSMIGKSKLGFSFEIFYMPTLDAAYKDLRLKDYGTDLDKDGTENNAHMEFLNYVDSNISYDPNLSAKQNALNNCEYAKNNISEKKEAYQAQVITDSKKQDYITKINDRLDKNARTNRSLIAPQYGHIDLINDMKTIEKYVTISENKTRAIGGNLIYGTGHDENGQTVYYTYYDRLATLLGVNHNHAINFLAGTCNNVAHIDIDTRVDTDGDGILDSDDPSVASVRSGKLFTLYTYVEPKIDFDTEYDCSILSDFAELISKGYFTLEMVGLVIVVALSIMDYVKVFLNDDSDAMKKANSHLFKRLILVVVLFLLPGIVNFALRLFNVEGLNSDNPLCVEITNR